MVSDVIKITSLKAGLQPEDLALLDECEAMIPSDWLALYKAFGSGTLSDHLAVFEPLDFKKTHWPRENRDDALGHLQIPNEPVRLPWIDEGMLILGKCDWGWVTTGLPGTTELRLHPSLWQETEDGVETFASIEQLLASFTKLPSERAGFPKKAFFESQLDRRVAGAQPDYDAPNLVQKVQSMNPDEVFISSYSLCFHFRAYEALIILHNYTVAEEDRVQMSAIFNPERVDPAVSFFVELNALLRS